MVSESRGVVRLVLYGIGEDIEATQQAFALGIDLASKVVELLCLALQPTFPIHITRARNISYRV